MKLRVGENHELIVDWICPGVELDMATRSDLDELSPRETRERHPVDYWDAYSMQHQVFNLSGTDPEHVADVLREAADWIERQEVLPVGFLLHQCFQSLHGESSTELSVIYG